MKKYTFILALTGLLATGAVTSSYACEGGKCKMEQTDKKKKSKKDKKAAKTESCHAPAVKEETTTQTTKSCCSKQEAAKPVDTKGN